MMRVTNDPRVSDFPSMNPLRSNKTSSSRNMAQTPLVDIAYTLPT